MKHAVTSSEIKKRKLEIKYFMICSYAESINERFIISEIRAIRDETTFDDFMMMIYDENELKFQ
jgi:hypothetical protein